ncbi:sushi domain-containing protein 5 isoform X2 [Notolabrus celidotus]|nr:sushi domain-containing protein 5 isoform X2 [Notolabrus celidotus]
MGDELLYTCVPGYLMPSGHKAFSLLCDSCGEWYGMVEICVKDETVGHIDYEDKFPDSYEEAEHHNERPAEAQGEVYEEVHGAANPSQKPQEMGFTAEVEEEPQDQREEHTVEGEVIGIRFEGRETDEERPVEDFIGHPRWQQERREVVTTDVAPATQAPVSLLSQKHLFWFPSEAFQEEGHPVSSNPSTQTTQRASGAQSEESKEQESQERKDHHQHSVPVDDHDPEPEDDDHNTDDRDDRNDSHHQDKDDHEDSHHDDQEEADSHQEEDDRDDHMKHYIPAQDRHEKHDDHDDHYDMGEHEEEREHVRYGSQEYDDRDDTYDEHEGYEDHGDLTGDHEKESQEHPDGSEEHPDRDDHDDGQHEEHYDLEGDDNEHYPDHGGHEHDDHDSYDDHDSHEDFDDAHQHVIISTAKDDRQNITQKAAGGKVTTDDTWLDGYPVVRVEENDDSTTDGLRPEDEERETVVRTSDKPNEVEIRRPVPYTNLPEVFMSPTDPSLVQRGVEETLPGFTYTAAPSQPSDSPSHPDTLDYDTQQAAPTHSWLGGPTEHPYLDQDPAQPMQDTDTLSGVIEEHTLHNLPGEKGERGEMEGEMGEAMCIGENCSSPPPSSSSRGPTVAAIIAVVCMVAAAVIIGVWCYRRQQQKSSMYEMNGKGQSQSRQGQHIEMQQKV